MNPYTSFLGSYVRQLVMFTPFGEAVLAMPNGALFAASSLEFHDDLMLSQLRTMGQMEVSNTMAEHFGGRIWVQ